MATPALPLVLGAVSLITTTVLIAITAVVAKGSWSSTNQAGLVAAISAALEAVVLIVSAILLVRVLRSSKFSSERCSSLVFASSLLTCLAAAVVSVVMIVLSKKANDAPLASEGGSSTGLVVGSAVALGPALASQLAFVVAHFILGRPYRFEKAHAMYVHEEGRHSPEMRVKVIPYSKTVISVDKTEPRFTMDELSRPGSSSCQSLAGTMSSIRTSFSHVVRPVSSKSKLVSSGSRSQRRAPSMDSMSFRDPIAHDGFDTWDTSSIETASLSEKPALNTSLTVPPRVLETIPASPTVSRTPSPGNPLDFETPRINRRSRSYSPLPRGRQERSLSPQSSAASLTESHIHPLFRSDSPVPPPCATPGTIVIASPNAGRTISEKSLSRMRSGSLPTSSSPLSRQASEDSIRKTSSPAPHAETSSSRSNISPPKESTERALTPPIPDWVLNSASHASLSEQTG